LAKVKFQKFTHSTIERIFECATNFESFQTMMPQFFPSIRIISVRPNTTLVEEHIVIGGRELVVMAKHVLNAPKIHETFIVGGDAKGTHIKEEYEQLSEGTQITVSVDFKPKGSMRLSGIFGKVNVENEFSSIMDEIILVAEG
jgi:coenzyme Q-binding protein COQ10